jgi:hypothetical protein
VSSPAAANTLSPPSGTFMANLYSYTRTGQVVEVPVKRETKTFVFLEPMPLSLYGVMFRYRCEIRKCFWPEKLFRDIKDAKKAAIEYLAENIECELKGIEEQIKYLTRDLNKLCKLIDA